LTEIYLKNVQNTWLVKILDKKMKISLKISQNPIKNVQKWPNLCKKGSKNPWYRVKRVSEKSDFGQKVDKKLKKIEKFHEKKSSIKIPASTRN